MANYIQSKADTRDGSTKPAVVKPDWRTREARAARQVAKVDQAGTKDTGQTIITETANSMPLVDPKVLVALRDVEFAKSRRDSVKRKMDGGSAAVSAEGLEHWEHSLTHARFNLGDLSSTHPDSLLRALA
jgi:hypothetical protein